MVGAAPKNLERLLTWRSIVGLALPAASSAVLQSAFRPVDQFFVSWLGTEAQGALGATTYVTIFIFGAYLVISGGVGPMVGRAIGEGDLERAREVVGAGLVGAAIVSVLVAIVGLLLSPAIVFCLGLTGAAADHAVDYIWMLSVAGVALSFGPVIDASFAAKGNTVAPMVLQSFVLALNIALTPLLLFVVGMGTEGAALATALAQVFGVGVGLWLLHRYMGLR
ncbi:MAG: Na+-driven multidrug efflux pump, partial [Kiritimatiellia bacterium]